MIVLYVEQKMVIIVLYVEQTFILINVKYVFLYIVTVYFGHFIVTNIYP